MELTFKILIIAFILDLLLGDPRWFPHPVILIGKAISSLEKWLLTWAPTPGRQRGAGVILVLLVVGGTYALTWGLLRGLAEIHPMAAVGGQIVLLTTIMATRSLWDAGRAILIPLKIGDLQEARRRLSWVVGRDTQELSEKEVVRGTVETVAENTVDGIVSPLFYSLIGGVPLAMAYKAINTLDSMVGYKNERYLHFGWASAHLDDLANWIPARITGGLLLLVAVIYGLPGKEGWKIWRRDASLHPSPNSGVPEAVVAGVLGVRLGGTNYYQGVPSVRAFMGDPKNLLAWGHIRSALNLMMGTAWFATALGALFLWWIRI